MLYCIRETLCLTRPANCSIRELGGAAFVYWGESVSYCVMTRSAYRFQFLAPPGIWPAAQNTLTANAELYSQYLGSLQRLRGPAYLQDGAIQPWHLDILGRHSMDDDERCWHFVLLDRREVAIGCAR